MRERFSQIVIAEFVEAPTVCENVGAFLYQG
jgi:hypothetical protein